MKIFLIRIEFYSKFAPSQGRTATSRHGSYKKKEKKRIKMIQESCLETAHRKKVSVKGRLKAIYSPYCHNSKENILQDLESLFQSLDYLSCVRKGRFATVRIRSGCQRMRSGIISADSLDENRIVSQLVITWNQCPT